MQQRQASPMDGAYTWTAQPARQNPRKAVAGGVLIVAMAAAAGLSFGLWWSALVGIVLALSLNRFFLPSRFVIDDQTITAHFPLRTVSMPWADLRRFVIDANGGYLSRRARRSWLDGYSGLHLIFDNDRERTIDVIRSHFNAAAASAPSAQHSEPKDSLGGRAWAG